MTKNKNISLFNSTLKGDLIQLKMNFDIDFCLEEDVKLQLVHKLVEGMDLSFLRSVGSRKGRKTVVEPISMIKILIYTYSEGIYSARKIEKMCKYDLRIISILNGGKAPDYSTINRFRQKIAPFWDEILNQFNQIMISNNQIDTSSIYIDGTKVEAYANRYSFVWKKSVLKYQSNLRKKIIQQLKLDEDMNLENIKKYLKLRINRLQSDITKLNIKFVFGKRKRKSEIQREFELLNEWLEKLKTYDKHLEIMGQRNSHSKTDHDATFMRMKDDHMRKGQLKPGYNIQMATTGNFIVGIYASHHPSDMYTLPLFLDKLKLIYANKLDKIVCDAGYESEENYAYLDKNDLRAFIKPSNYEISKTRKHKEKAKFRENLIYDKIKDKYIDTDGKEFVRVSDRKTKKISGYISISKVYKCFDWNKDGYKSKSIYFTETFNEYRKNL